MAAETMRITEELIVADKTGPGLDSAERKVSAFDRTIQNTQSRLDKMSGSRWSVTVGAVDKATSVISTVESKLSSGIRKAWNFTVGLIDKVTSPLQGIFNLLRNPILQAGAVLGISLSAADVIQTFGGFEATMSQVKAISGATGEDFEALTSLAREMGATTKFTAEEAAQGLTYMAMAGWKTEDMMTSLSGIMNLAAASGEDLATVSDIVTDAMTAFGLAADGVTASGVANATHFSDVLAAASSNANTNVAMMGETFKYVGSMAGAMEYSIEDVALATGLMANSGIKGTMAGTALNAVITRLSTNTSGAADAISELGVEFYNSDGSARALSDVLGDLRKATMGMTAAQKSELANTVAGMEAQKGLLAILNTSEEDYNTLAEAIYNADGAAQQMSDTMLDNMQGSLTLLKSAVDGVKLSLGSRLSPYVRQFADWLTTKMPAVEEVIDSVMNTIDGKIAGLKATIEEFTSSEEWADADIWGKIKIAWDKIVAEPFAEWWDSTGKPWLVEKIGSFGETIGSGLSKGILALLGFDASGAVEDGKSIGSSFIEGFKQGFDTEQVSAAITEWAQDHKGIIAAAGVIAGGKLIGGIARFAQSGIGLGRSISNLFGGGSSAAGAGTGSLGNALSTYTTNTMTVTAGTVIVNGSNTINTSGAGSAAQAVGTALLGGGTGAAATAALPATTGGATLALPAAAGGAATAGSAAATAGGVTSATGVVGTILQAGSTSSVVAADGTLLAVQGGVGGTLGSVGGALGSGATTAAGTAAAGAGAIGGAIAALIGLVGAGIDVFQGAKKDEAGDAKGAKDEYITAGTKVGMIGAGAGTGALIGSVVPGLGTAIGAIVGAGVGGIASLFGGDSAGKAISDSTDEGGWLNTAGKDIGNFVSNTVPTFFTGLWGDVSGFFSETVPAAAASVGQSVSGFFTDTVPGFFGGLWDDVSGFFTQTIPSAASSLGNSIGGFFTKTVPDFFTKTVPYAAGYAFGAAEVFFGETVPEFFTELFNDIGTFFGETLPTWAAGVWNDNIVPFFTESLPEFFTNILSEIGTFFGETVPTWASGVWNDHIVPFFTQTVPEFFGGLFTSVAGFFTETVPAWASGIWNDHVVPFFTVSLPAFFGNLWASVSGFFTETLPTWADSVYQKAATFFGTTVPEFVTNLWTQVSSFVTETVPAWAESAFDSIATFFTVDIPGFFSSLWETVSSAVAGQVAAWGAAIASAVSGWWEAISGWFDQLWSTISGAFGAGRAAGRGAHAEGGIMNAPHTAQVAEDGPEAIIPLGTSSRSRGMAIWEQAGDILGADQDDSPAAYVTTQTRDGGEPATPVSVPVNIAFSPEIIIQAAEGMSEEDIVEILKRRVRELVDDISDEMAERLARVFANMPVRGGA